MNGAFNSLGNNFISRAALGNGFSSANSDQVSFILPLVAKLSAGVVSGKTGTFPPLFGSPLVGAGNGSAAGLPSTDQVGNPRIDGTIDIGAVEFVRQEIGVNVIDTDAAERFSSQPIDYGRIVLQSASPLEDVTLERVASESLAGLSDFEILPSADMTVSGGQIILTNITNPVITFIPIDDQLVEGAEKLTLRVVDTEFVESLDPAIPNTGIIITDNDQLVTDFGSSGAGTLRDAIAALGTDGGTIFFDQSGAETVDLASDIVLPAGRFEICGHLAGTTISGSSSTQRLFTVPVGADLTLKELSLTGGSINGWGGAVYALNLLTVDGCTFYGNSATDRGGAIYGEGSSTVTVTNTTISANSAITGGGLYLRGNSTLHNVTIAKNSASAEGGGLFTDGSTELENTLIGDNTAPLSPDLSGTITTDGGNLVEDASGSIGLTAASDQTGVDPVLGPLSFVGGPTPVHPLWIGSPAIDAAVFPFAIDYDQRGLAREVGNLVDVGAYEHQYVDYSYWADYMIPGIGAEDQMDQDPDFDGFPNVIEFICDTDPLLGTSFPNIKVGKTSGGVNLEISRNEIVDPAHVSASSSENLIGWDDTAINEIEFSADGDNTKRVRFSTSNGLTGRNFMRIDFVGPAED